MEKDFEKERAFEYIDLLRDQLIDLSDYIHSNPELGNHEFKAKNKIIEYLEKMDFEIAENAAGLSTAFVATYKKGDGGPVIGLLCEYDALEGLGHACGHNLQSATMVGAAASICKGLQTDAGFTIKVIGTPAEETTSAKIPMTEQGIFDDLDVALMMHGGDRTTVDGDSLACSNFKFTFAGKASHAAVAPEKGRSALDSVLMTFNGIEYLREHVTPDVRMHGVITDGGIKANIVPASATAEFSIRAKYRPYLDQVIERVFNVAKGAALATETTLSIFEEKRLESKLNVPVLNQILLNNARDVKADQITEPRKRTGSTDFSVVTHRVPGACVRVSFVPMGVPNHTEEWEIAAKSAEGHKAVLKGAKIISGTIIDILSQPDLLNEIKQEFENTKRLLEEEEKELLEEII